MEFWSRPRSPPTSFRPLLSSAFPTPLPASLSRLHLRPLSLPPLPLSSSFPFLLSSPKAPTRRARRALGDYVDRPHDRRTALQGGSDDPVPIASLLRKQLSKPGFILPLPPFSRSLRLPRPPPSLPSPLFPPPPSPVPLRPGRLPERQNAGPPAETEWKQCTLRGVQGKSEYPGFIVHWAFLIVPLNS